MEKVKKAWLYFAYTIAKIADGFGLSIEEFFADSLFNKDEMILIRQWYFIVFFMFLLFTILIDKKNTNILIVFFVLLYVKPNHCAINNE